MTRPRLLFYCQHSLGLGHLSRSLALCSSLSERFKVVLLCGGKLPKAIKPPDGVELVMLPPLGATIEGRIISHDARRSLDRARELRRELILRTFRSAQPEALMIEFFPFGKKRFKAELLPLLEEAKDLGAKAPLVVCSIRDILVSRGPEQQDHDDHASDLANRYFDAVLIHSDPGFARLEESFRPRLPLRTPIYYTGFVVPNGSSSNGSPQRGQKIVVSAGGGIVGAQLLRAAIRARRLLAEDVEMKVVAGPFLPEVTWRSLRAEAAGTNGLTLQRSVKSLSAELRTASASVSQCGYNTALDILRARVPALVVPFSDSGEDEQTKRAGRLQAAGAVRVLDPHDLEPLALAKEIRALLSFRPRPVPVDLNGGPRTARILDVLHSGRFGILMDWR
ncbi:MAG: glycosyltransferase family protein [Actinomycetota bacterium]